MKRRKVTFTKMSGGGNDFIVIDNRRGQAGRRSSRPSGNEGNNLARMLCARKWSVGADGLLLLESSRRAAFRMRYYNADGSRAAMCGNGARCLARFAQVVGAVPREMTFETDAGLIQAHVNGKEVEIGFPDPALLALKLTVRIADRRWTGAWLQVGVPHFVVFVPELQRLNVPQWGRALREHRRFAPRGTNVNFVQRVSSRRIRLRTYERGVEDETLACGTGAVASAVAAGLRGLVKPPVACRTRGGEILTVNYQLKSAQIHDKVKGLDSHLRRNDKGAAGARAVTVTDVALRGPAEITFQGEVLV